MNAPKTCICNSCGRLFDALKTKTICKDCDNQPRCTSAPILVKGKPIFINDPYKKQW
jgi:hypothetical protein